MLSTLLTSIFTGEAALAVKRARAASIAYAIIGVLLFLAAIFLLIAAFIYSSWWFGPFHTAIGFGVGFIVLALLVFAGFKFSSRARAIDRKQRQRGEIASLATAAALAAAPALLKGRSAAGLFGLPLVGLIAYQIYRENQSLFSGSVAEDLEDEVDD